MENRKINRNDDGRGRKALIVPGDREDGMSRAAEMAAVVFLSVSGPVTFQENMEDVGNEELLRQRFRRYF